MRVDRNDRSRGQGREGAGAVSRARLQRRQHPLLLFATLVGSIHHGEKIETASTRIYYFEV